MEFSLALKLAEDLRAACPVDSGALRMSISRVQGTSDKYFITIGNEQGKEINGKCATIEYAAITNFAPTLNIHGKQYRNRNYHWVNDAVERWIQQNKLNFAMAEVGTSDDIR